MVLIMQWFYIFLTMTKFHWLFENTYMPNLKWYKIHKIIVMKINYWFLNILANITHCQRPRRGPPVIPHPNLRLQRGTSSSVVSSRKKENEEVEKSQELTKSTGGGSVSCEPQFLEKCIKMANPLLKEPKHVFPSTAEDVEHVCRSA